MLWGQPGSLVVFLRQVSDTIMCTSLDSLDEPSRSADLLSLLDLCTRLLLLISAMSQAAQTDVAQVSSMHLCTPAAAADYPAVGDTADLCRASTVPRCYIA